MRDSKSASIRLNKTHLPTVSPHLPVRLLARCRLHPLQHVEDRAEQVRVRADARIVESALRHFNVLRVAQAPRAPPRGARGYPRAA